MLNMLKNALKDYIKKLSIKEDFPIKPSNGPVAVSALPLIISKCSTIVEYFCREFIITDFDNSYNNINSTSVVSSNTVNYFLNKYHLAYDFEIIRSSEDAIKYAESHPDCKISEVWNIIIYLRSNIKNFDVDYNIHNNYKYKNFTVCNLLKLTIIDETDYLHTKFHLEDIETERVENYMYKIINQQDHDKINSVYKIFNIDNDNIKCNTFNQIIERGIKRRIINEIYSLRLLMNELPFYKSKVYYKHYNSSYKLSRSWFKAILNTMKNLYPNIMSMKDIGHFAKHVYKELKQL